MLDWFLDSRDCEGVNSFIRIRLNHSAATAKHQRRRNQKLRLRLSLRCSWRFHFIAPLGRDSPRLASGGFGKSARRSQVDVATGVWFFDNRRPDSANEVHARSGAWDSEVQSSGTFGPTHRYEGFSVERVVHDS